MEILPRNVEVWKSRFRRLYAADLAGLKTLSDSVASEAGESVTITGSSFEGGSATGTLTGNKMEMLDAIESLISELDAAAAAAAQPVRMIYTTFPCIPH